MMDFSGRTAFVTGGARGIGAGIVQALLRRDVNVAVADVDPAALSSVGSSERLRCYQLDVADREQYADVAAQVQRHFGDVSLLFNNAGIVDSVSPSKLSYPLWDYVMGVNLAGVYNGIQTFLPGMLASSQRCHIVNTSSEAGLLEAGSGFLYHASKFAVVGLSESLRRELAPLGVGVSVLFPGPVATGIVENARKLRPASAPRHSARVTAIFDTAHRVLNSEGASPEAVGEWVIESVAADAPYIGTRNGLKDALRHRTEEIVTAMDHAEDFVTRAAALG